MENHTGGQSEELERGRRDGPIEHNKVVPLLENILFPPGRCIRKVALSDGQREQSGSMIVAI